jgi:hypothetical protein
MLCTQIAPRIRSAIPATVKPIGAEDHEELIQDTIATAVLAEVNGQPLWRNNIMAGRERRACRAARL